MMNRGRTTNLSSNMSQSLGARDEFIAVMREMDNEYDRIEQWIHPYLSQDGEAGAPFLDAQGFEHVVARVTTIEARLKAAHERWTRAGHKGHGDSDAYVQTTLDAIKARLQGLLNMVHDAVAKAEHQLSLFAPSLERSTSHQRMIHAYGRAETNAHE